MDLLPELVIRGAFLAGLALAVLHLPFVRRVAGRGAVLVVALAWLTVLPALVVLGPRWSVAVLPMPALTPSRLSADDLLDLAVSRPVDVAPVEKAGPPDGVRDVSPAVSHWTGLTIVSFYVAVAGLILLLRVAAAVRAARMIRRALPVRTGSIALAMAEASRALGVHRVPRLCVSEEASLPFVCGLLRPTVVFPRAAESWTETRLRAVALHETAHVRRHDLFTRALGQLACALNWLNPLAWTVARRLDAESEVACDDLVITAGVPAESYARELVHLARQFNGVPLIGPAIGIAGASELQRRITAILATRPPRAGALRVTATAALTCVMSLGSALADPVRAQAGAAPDSRWLNVSDGSPEISSNGAGLQARWVENGRHAAIFLTGSVDLRDARRGRVGGQGSLIMLEEGDGENGLRVFEWRSGTNQPLPTEVRRMLELGANQLAILSGRRDKGLPGSTLSGLPAVSDDPTAHVVQAGWLAGDQRYGMALRGRWRSAGDTLTSSDPRAWLVTFAVDRRTGSTRRLQIARGQSGSLITTFFVNGAGAEVTDAAHAWAVSALRALQRMAPDYAGVG